MAPTVDTNLPPETWITAAPQDTLTSRDENGNLVPPNPGTIPFRYHVYWSGSDQDGAVSGFYWAVTETVGSVGGLPIPPLPGPKPQDYRYTSTRDSTFIFNVLEETNNRQHAFYIYAVDNKGKPDATPARVIFNSLDLYPPIPVIEAECGVPNPTTGSRATGLIFHPNDAWAGGGAPVPVPTETTMALCDTFSRRTTVSDIIPMGAVVNMQWHSEIRVANNPAVAYKYKIGEGDEVEFVQVPATVTSTQYNTTDRNRLAPGLKIFTLRAIDQAGGARTSPETTRRFTVNWTPDTWFAGPDTVPPGFTNVNNFYTTTWYGPPGGSGSKVKERYFSAGQGSNPTGWGTALPGSLLSPDSLIIMPARRKANKTFFEVYTEYNFANTTQHRHRIYVHGEGDTIHMNSWVLLQGGGFDADSPYSLRISGTNDNLPGIGVRPVLKSGPANGSPVGFRYRIPVFLDSIGPVSTFPESPVYPSSEPSSPPLPRIGGYQGMQQSGRAYAILRSEDGNRGVDRRIEDPVAFVDSIEKGLIPPNSPRYALKDKVLTFYVNRAPYLLPTFEPRNGQVYLSRSGPTGPRLRLDLAADDDPYQSLQRSIGGMEEGKSSLLLRFSVTFRGRRTGSSPPKDTVWAPPELARKTGLNVAGGVAVDIPTFIQGPNVGIDIEVCDCRDCEAVPGQGRCRRYPTINISVPAVTAEAVSQSRASASSTGPGTSGESGRSRTP